MTALFPSNTKTFPTLVDLVDSVLAAHQNERGEEITAIEEYLISTLIGAEGVGINYQIVPSVASNNLTVDIKCFDASTPSATHPIKIRVGNNILSATATGTFTKNAGTNWMNMGSTDLIGGNSVDLFLYAINETGASAGLKFGCARHPHALTMADFVNTATDEKYIMGSWTNFNSTDKVAVIGRFRASLSVTSFNWSIPSANVINRPIYETDWLAYTPLPTGFSAVPGSSNYRYQVRGNSVTLVVRQNADGTSNATTFTIPLPLVAKSISNMAWGSAGVVRDNNVTQTTPGALRILTAATAMDVYKDFASAAFTNSGNKRLAQMGPITYEIL